MKDEYLIDISNPMELQQLAAPNQFRMLLTQTAKEKMLSNGLAKAIVPDISNERTYPYDHVHGWTVDNFGPLWIPKKGATLTLTDENYTLYERAIRVYEGNTLEKINGKIMINGKESNQYTFTMNYYWMMGDNRHESQDSRFWGFVPEDHVVGEAWLIWMSWDKGVRWSRLFRTIR